MHTFRRSIALFVGAALLAGCGDDSVPAVGAGDDSYRVTVRRTSFGIPHVRANDLGSMAFGLGYAGAQDFICTLADQILKVRSERAATFGPGEDDANIDSDLAYLGLGVYERGKAMFASSDLAELATGYAAGYNNYLETTGVANLPAPCAGAAWVKPISDTDLAAYYMDLTLRGSSIPFLGYVADAQPPGQKAKSGSTEGLHLPDFRHPHMGSNGWAIGKDRAEGGRGMLIANPHFPWEGEMRFYESHLTVPGVLDVYGASLLGVPVVNIGFNADVAWTHTVTPANHFTLYKLALSPDDPTTYLYDGQPRKMTSQDVTIDVLGNDGKVTQVTRTFWRSHYGPMVNVPGLVWNKKQAFSYRDANETNARIGEQWLRMDMAKSVDEIVQVHEEVQGIPWVYTITADKEGNAMLLDGSRVPNLSAETVAAYQDALAHDPLTQAVADAGVVMLDGSTSESEWVDTGKPDAPGLVPVADGPHLKRTDFAMNANDAPWLTNPAEPLTDYPLLYGAARTPASPRTRMNLVTLTETGEGSPSGADGKFSFEELQKALLLDRAMLAELLRAGVAARCAGVASVNVGGTPVDITAACDAIAGWDSKMDLDRVGPVVWREFLASFDWAAALDKGTLFAVGFDPDDPVATPNTLAPAPATGDDPILVALGNAARTLEEAGMDPTTPLGDAQYTLKGDERIALHGGSDFEGVTNVITNGENNSTLLPRMPQGHIVDPVSGLSTSGYLVNYGSSFVMALEFTDEGPRAAALLSYSESSDGTSAHFDDQTKRFSAKNFRPILFTEAEIAADPELHTIELAAPRR